MDPQFARVLPEIFGALFGFLAIGGVPVALVYLSKHFKLRTRELELEAELHGRDSQARIQAMETRLAAMESALLSIVQGLRRPELMSPPDAPQAEAGRIAAVTKVK